MPVDLETADVMNRIFKSIDETKGLVSHIVVCKANFLMMAYYLLDLRQLVEDLSREECFTNATSLEAQASLQSLADTLEAIYSFTKCCKNSSRILLLYQSNALVDQITKQFGELVHCLSLMLQRSTMLSSTTEVQIKEMQNKLSEALFYVEPEHEKIAQQLSQALKNGQADDSLATDLLCVISTTLNMKFYEAGELIQELKGDLETARIERREEELILLQSLHTLLNPAVLPDVNLLVPEDSPFSANDLAIPSSFFCPITRQIMEDPVMLAEAGYTYERSAILKWFEGGNTICPNTGKELENFELIPNLKLKQNMEEFFDLKRHKTMLHAIQQIRSQGTSTDVEESVNTVKQLLDVNLKYKRLLVTLDGIQPLVAILKPSTPQLKEKIFRILFSIAALGDEYKASIVEAKAVPVLLRILQRNPAVNGGPVQLLWELSKSEAGRAAILDEKASVVVVASAFNLCTSDQKLQAEQLLYNLCEHDSTAIIQAATSGVFGPLVRKLASGDEDLQLKMAETICTLNVNEKSMHSLVGAGVIQPLLNLLQHGTEACKLKAAKAFELLSSFDDNKIAIARSGSLSVLVKAVTSQFRDIVTLVLATLANLATEKQIAAEIEHEGAVLQLIGMFTWEDINIHENALRTLDHMAKDNRMVRQSIAHSKAIPKFYSLLQSEKISPSCKTSILNLVSYLAEDHSTRSAIVNPRTIVGFFVRLLKGQSSDEREAVLAILSAMAKMEETKHIMVLEESLLQISVECLKSDRLKVKECAVVILSKLTDPNLVDKSVQLNLARLGMIPLLIDVLKNDSERAKQHAAVTLGQLSMQTPNLTEKQSFIKKLLAKLGFAKYKTCKVHAGKCSAKGTLCLVESEAVPQLIGLINDGRNRSAQRAIEALLTLVKGSENMEKGIDYLVKNDIIVPLVQIIGNNENSTEKAVMMLERIFKCQKYRNPRYANLAKQALYTTMATGNTDTRKAAATALMHLGMVPKSSTYAHTG
ncbi:hypothetical protein SUGI_0252920 [Cryptomeria japonica]|uniref:U-box domain-containing protein 44 n=1 Tax=Cryptomeria japonica TaxID=3369 RepID=UPI002408A028|nr:U-box domain-containing protein 44 [Cryptomeria japonica]XP_057869737.2 U-box domain-containing protein 44 [Cryptomeria japonica]XP_057869738.2 U-box domain-containing protein 44 [Cryptomeria japonica]GLJ15407.1 hypothetical protein SUGI_0252920 [Cryptomeria japonica]